MFDMMKRHQVQVLRGGGHSQRQVARLAGVSRGSVQRIEVGAPAPEQAASGKRRLGRPSKVEPFRSHVVEWLKQQPDILTLEVLRRLRDQHGYAGGKSAVYELLASIRPEPVAPIVRFEGVPGEFTQHDFGEVDVRFTGDDSVERIHFFATRYKYSRWVQVSVVPNQQTETLVRSVVEHFHLAGGVPLLAVFDRPATVVLKWRGNGEPTAWNPVFQDVMLQLGVGVELCWPARGNQKGAVENLVGFVKGSFFKQRRFVDREDMLTQLTQWLHEVNHVRPSRATGVTPADRMAAERARLRPLRVTPDELVLRYPVVVGPTGYVLFDTNAYSMPPDTLGLPATLHLQRESLTISTGKHDAIHPRLTGRHQKSTLPAHRGQLVAAVHGRRAHNYAKRQQLLDLGQSVFDWLTEVIHRRQNTWHNDVNHLFELLLQHGDQRLLAAIEQAHHQQVFGAEYVAHTLRSLEVHQ
jgi:transposase